MEQTAQTGKAAAKAAALLAQDTEALKNAVSKHETDKAAALAEFEALGQAAGRNAGSLTIAAMKFAKLVGEGALSIGEGKAAKGDDAETVYLRFVAGFNATVTSGTDAMATDAKTPISTFRSFGKAARFHKGDETFFARVLETWAATPKDQRVSGYNALVACNRKLCEAGDENKGVAAEIVFATTASDVWVQARCLKKVTADKATQDKVADLIAKLGKFGESDECPGLAVPMAALRDWFAGWKAGGFKTELETVELLKADAAGNA